MNHWDSPATVAAWLAFDRAHDRYRRVNAAIAQHAKLAPGLDVLDVGAGTGGTTRALLPSLGPTGSVCCVEPAAAMRDAGHQDPRVRWCDAMPESARFDRVVCGAAVWLMRPLRDTLGRLSARLHPGGALVFAMPAAYLGEADPAGGGPDPWLADLVQAVVAGRPTPPTDGQPLPDAAAIDRRLAQLGLRARTWTVETRWTLRAYADWLALPPVGLAMRPDLDAAALRALVARAHSRCAPGSWRVERWRGWTACA